ncbi:MAG: NAD(P)-binding protein [Lawsonibacter sp.]|nr:NAD(P)-binding protein [Lawsonibacter sp.]
MGSFKEELNACMQNDPPPCASVCPFGLDVRAFIGHLKRGAFSAAFRLYRDAVAFPGIVSQLCDRPCRDTCVFSAKGGPIALRDLEAAAIAHAPNTRPNNYNLPKRSARVAVIGAGPSGLACALRLASKKYDVVIFEKEERMGGSLWSLLPEQVFMPELERQFMFERVEYRFSAPVDDLAQVQADAVYVATGRGGACFGLELSGQGACASRREGFFLGGALAGRSTMEAIADGLLAAKAIERYLKIRSMNEPPRDYSTRFHPNPDLLPYTPPAPRTGEVLTKEEAVAEAGRCQQCQCDACVKYCDLMRSYHKYPKRVEEEVQTTIEPVSLSRKARLATRFIATCSHCGLCKQVCPVSLDTGAYLLDSHRRMVEEEAMPWAYHEFWLRDMEFSNTEASLVLDPSGSGTPKYLFFPGCRLGGSDPRLVLDSFNTILVREPSSALYLGCCGAPAEWAGEKPLHDETVGRFAQVWEGLGRPRVVFACLNCLGQLTRHLPQAEGVSLYELLDSWDIPVAKIGAGQAVSVFDPCPSRDFPAAQAAVRSLARKAGFRLEPLPLEGAYAQCCGWGGQVEIANPKYAEGVTQNRMEASPLPYLVYCANCRDIFARRGKETAHLLRALLPQGEGGLWNTSAPTATQSRDNRRWLKRQLLLRYYPEEAPEMETTQGTAPLLITPELLDKMNRAYLLREDAEFVVETCERTGQTLTNPERGTHIGHALVGRMTVWAEYRNLENCRELVNIYAHRMRILEENKHV